MKMLVIGLDCAAPWLVFERWRDDLPHLRHIADNGIWGELQSCIPPITVPAWSSMLSGKDPGQLGIYGFRNRADYSYERMFIASANYVREKRAWDYLSEVGKRSIVVGVPQTYPVSPLNGELISGFLTPGISNEFTYPASLKQEVLDIAPDYEFDVREFRTDNKDWLLQQIWEMTEKRFKVVDHLLKSREWDFFMLMEIGVDRIHHGFWSYHDPGHRRYEAGNPYENAIRDYYIFIDRQIGQWLEVIDDQTQVLVVSDHGAKRMDGGICLNEWLWREGYLRFNQDPVPGEITAFDDMEINWSETKAWGSGGYYGRIFLNVQGREPQGIIPASQMESVRDELVEKLRSIPDPEGGPLNTRVFKPQEIYKEVRAIPPDLMVFFDDLYWRAIGSLGHGDIHTFSNDIGPDDCNHAENGLFLLHDPQNSALRGKVEGAQLVDIASTILDAFGIPIPPDLQGQSLFGNSSRS